jgi:hypothetical protein
MGPLAGGTANFDTIVIYDAYGDYPGGTVATAIAAGGYDPTAEVLSNFWYTFNNAVTGAATNFDSFGLVQRNAAGTVKNQISVAYSAAGVTTAAWAPVNLGVGSGAVVPGAGTGTLTVTTGTALPWTMVVGDILYVVMTPTGTGLGLTANTFMFWTAVTTALGS